MKIKICSSTSGELIALRDGIKRVWKYTRMFYKIFGHELPVLCMIDSMPLRDILACGTYEADPEFQGCVEYCLEKLEMLGARVQYVPTNSMLADNLTKFKTL